MTQYDCRLLFLDGFHQDENNIWRPNPGFWIFFRIRCHLQEGGEAAVPTPQAAEEPQRPLRPRTSVEEVIEESLLLRLVRQGWDIPSLFSDMTKGG